MSIKIGIKEEMMKVNVKVKRRTTL